MDRDWVEGNNFVGKRCEKNVPNHKVALANDVAPTCCCPPYNWIGLTSISAATFYNLARA